MEKEERTLQMSASCIIYENEKEIFKEIVCKKCGSTKQVALRNQQQLCLSCYMKFIKEQAKIKNIE